MPPKLPAPLSVQDLEEARTAATIPRSASALAGAAFESSATNIQQQHPASFQLTPPLAPMPPGGPSSATSTPALPAAAAGVPSQPLPPAYFQFHHHHQHYHHHHHNASAGSMSVASSNPPSNQISPSNSLQQVQLHHQQQHQHHQQQYQQVDDDAQQEISEREASALSLSAADDVQPLQPQQEQQQQQQSQSHLPSRGDNIFSRGGLGMLPPSSADGPGASRLAAAGLGAITAMSSSHLSHLGSSGSGVGAGGGSNSASHRRNSGAASLPHVASLPVMAMTPESLYYSSPPSAGGGAYSFPSATSAAAAQHHYQHSQHQQPFSAGGVGFTLFPQSHHQQQAMSVAPVDDSDWSAAYDHVSNPQHQHQHNQFIQQQYHQYQQQQQQQPPFDGMYPEDAEGAMPVAEPLIQQLPAPYVVPFPGHREVRLDIQTLKIRLAHRGFVDLDTVGEMHCREGASSSLSIRSGVSPQQQLFQEQQQQNIPPLPRSASSVVGHNILSSREDASAAGGGGSNAPGAGTMVVPRPPISTPPMAPPHPLAMRAANMNNYPTSAASSGVAPPPAVVLPPPAPPAMPPSHLRPMSNSSNVSVGTAQKFRLCVWKYVPRSAGGRWLATPSPTPSQLVERGASSSSSLRQQRQQTQQQSAQQQLPAFGRLTRDILHHSLAFLSTGDLAICSQVCAAWFLLADPWVFLEFYGWVPLGPLSRVKRVCLRICQADDGVLPEVLRAMSLSVEHMQLEFVGGVPQLPAGAGVVPYLAQLKSLELLRPTVHDITAICTSICRPMLTPPPLRQDEIDQLDNNDDEEPRDERDENDDVQQHAAGAGGGAASGSISAGEQLSEEQRQQLREDKLAARRRRRRLELERKREHRLHCLCISRANVPAPQSNSFVSPLLALRAARLVIRRTVTLLPSALQLLSGRSFPQLVLDRCLLLPTTEPPTHLNEDEGEVQLIVSGVVESQQRLFGGPSGLRELRAGAAGHRRPGSPECELPCCNFYVDSDLRPVHTPVQHMSRRRLYRLFLNRGALTMTTSDEEVGGGGGGSGLVVAGPGASRGSLGTGSSISTVGSSSATGTPLMSTRAFAPSPGAATAAAAAAGRTGIATGMDGIPKHLCLQCLIWESPCWKHCG